MNASLKVALVALLAACPSAQAEVIRLSVASSAEDTGSLGLQGDATSYGGDITADGRFVVFGSAATNLVGEDDNGVEDIYLVDRQSGAIERVSLGHLGQQGNARSYSPRVSADGRFVAFVSQADNLVPNDSNGVADVFVRDRQSGTTERVSVSSSGAQSDWPVDRPALSDDGRFVLFHAIGTSNLTETMSASGGTLAYLHDRQSGQTEVVSLLGDGEAAGLGSIEQSSISGDGRWIAFAAVNGSGLDPAILLRDRQTGSTSRIAAAPGVFSRPAMPKISRDGRFIAFTSFAADLVPDDTNAATDVFLHDRQAGTTVRASLASGGGQIAGASTVAGLSDDGRYIAFSTTALDPVGEPGKIPVQLYLHDLQAGTTERISSSPLTEPGDSNSQALFRPLSGDGRLVAFSSLASNLVAGDSNGNWDLFLRDRQSQATVRLSLADDDGPHPAAANGPSSLACCGAQLSGDGRLVVFESSAGNLLVDAIDVHTGVFLRDLDSGVLERISVSLSGEPANGPSRKPSISQDGSLVVFASEASDLVADDANGFSDIFLRNRSSGETLRLSKPVGGGDADGASHSPAISADGRVVAFLSQASNLVDDGEAGTKLLVLNIESGELERVRIEDDNGAVLEPSTISLSANGARVAFLAKPAGSPVWESPRMHVHDRQRGKPIPILEPGGWVDPYWPSAPVLSGDGRWLGYALEHRLVPWLPQVAHNVFIHELDTDSHTLVSRCHEDGSPTDSSSSPSISADGRFVAFQSQSDCIVPSDTNRTLDVFLYDRKQKRTLLISRDRLGAGGLDRSTNAALTPHASAVAFVSLSGNWQVDAGRISGHQDVFVAELPYVFQSAFE
jgi:Tol biopolymer transport system component